MAIFLISSLIAVCTAIANLLVGIVVGILNMMLRSWFGDDKK